MDWIILLDNRKVNIDYANRLKCRLDEQIIENKLQNKVGVEYFDLKYYFLSRYVSVIDSYIGISDTFISVIYNILRKSSSDCIGLKGTICINNKFSLFNNTISKNNETVLPITKLNPIINRVFLNNFDYYLDNDDISAIIGTKEHINDPSIIFIRTFVDVVPIMTGFQQRDNKNKVLVIIPAYNVEATITSSIESVLKQTHKNIVVVVVNNCSTDNTLSAIVHYEEVIIYNLPKSCEPHDAINHVLYRIKDFDYFMVHTANNVLHEDYIKDHYLNEPEVIFSKETFDKIGYFDSSGESGYVNRMIQYKLGKTFLFKKAFNEDFISMNIATIPERESILKKTINSILFQCDLVNVFLNGYENVPDFLLNNIKIVIWKSQDYTDKGDAGKFFNIEKTNGYFFTIDDDLAYPENYVETLVYKVNRYRKECIITCHGRVLVDGDIDSYYSESNMVDQCHCLQDQEMDKSMHVGGTGVMCIHSSTLKVKFEDFLVPNMADIWIFKLSQEQKVGIIGISHNSSWFKYLKDTSDQDTIHARQHNNDSIQTDIINRFKSRFIFIELLKYKNLKPCLLGKDFSLPLVSVIIPYNKDRGFLLEAIASVENQTYGNIELILSKSNNGVSYNLNKGIKVSSGVYIKYLCEDDVLTNNSIEDSVKTMLFENYDFIHGNSIDFNKDGTVRIYIPSIKYPTFDDALLYNMLHGGTLMYNKRVFNQYGLFDESLWTAEEYDFNLRLLSNNVKLGYCDNILYKYRLHTQQKSIGNTDAVYQGKRDAVREEIRSRYQLKEVCNSVERVKSAYNIFAAIPVNGRHELLPHTIKRLLTKCGVSKVYCMGNNKEDKIICENAGAEWIQHDNYPLGKKWNAGIEAAINSGIDYDGFLFVGSSDWISENWINIYAPYLVAFDMIGTTNCYFLDINTNGQRRLIHWKGYTNNRAGEAIGIGRMYSMRILKKLNGKLFNDAADSSMDYQSMQNVIKAGGLIKTFVADDAKTLSISTNKWVNKHKFETEIKNQVSSEEVNNADEWLRTWFPEGFEVFPNRINQIYLSESVENFRKELKEKYNLVNFYDIHGPVFVFGMYRQEDLAFVKNHIPYKVILWCGSDSIEINMIKNKVILEDIKALKNVAHLVGSKFVSDDLTRLGIKHTFVPITTASFELSVCPRGDDIYFYYSENSGDFYGLNYIDEIKKYTGLNVIVAKTDTYTHNELIEVYKKCFIGLRMTPHDGLSNTGCELGLMGRKIIHNGNQPNCINYRNIDDVIRIIKEEYKHRKEDNNYIAEEMRKFLDVGDSWLYEK